MDPAIVVPLGGMLTAIILAIGVPLARAHTKRIDAESRQPRIPGEVAERLERMEHALEAVAIEVERISEGQRFTTKLLSESVGRGDGRQIGPARSEQDRVT